MQVDPDEVAIGSVIVVQPGEKVPAGRRRARGRFQPEHQRPNRARACPAMYSEGDEIISGCINMSGVLKIRTTKEFGESTVSKILDLVENASSQQVPIRSTSFPGLQSIYTPGCRASPRWLLAVAAAAGPALLRHGSRRGLTGSTAR